MGIENPEKGNIGIRPAIPYSIIAKESIDASSFNGFRRIFYGEYPQNVADEKKADELEKLYHGRKLSKTMKHYRIPYITFIPDDPIPEYKYKNLSKCTR